MPDWLKDAADPLRQIPFGHLAIRMLMALAFGAVVAGVYFVTQRKSRADKIQFATTIVLLAVLIAMVTLVIGSNIARAFSLAGALAIIRFRTVVEDTRDTAFVIFAVVVGMGVGAELAYIPLVGTPIAAGAALVMSYWGRGDAPGDAEFALAVRLGLGRDANATFSAAFDKYLTSKRLRATITARQGSALDLTYIVRLRDENAAVAFVNELNQIDGVQNVELRRL